MGSSELGLRSFHDCPATQLKGSMDCSGLAILSRHEITEVDFRPFEQNPGKNFVEVKILGISNSLDQPSAFKQLSERLINKGVGRARILWNGLIVDVFTTHLVSYAAREHP